MPLLMPHQVNARSNTMNAHAALQNEYHIQHGMHYWLLSIGWVYPKLKSQVKQVSKKEIIATPVAGMLENWHITWPTVLTDADDVQYLLIIWINHKFMIYAIYSQ